MSDPTLDVGPVVDEAYAAGFADGQKGAEAENERLRSRLRVIRRTVESERGRNLDADRVIDRVAAWVDEALEGDDQ